MQDTIESLEHRISMIESLFPRMDGHNLVLMCKDLHTMKGELKEKKKEYEEYLQKAKEAPSQHEHQIWMDKARRIRG